MSDNCGFGMEYNKEQSTTLENLNKVISRLPEASNAFSGQHTAVLEQRTPFGDYSFYRKFDPKTNKFYYEFIGHVII